MKNNKEELYFAGKIIDKANSLNTNFSNSTNIRLVKAIEGNLVFDELLKTMNVDFVKNGELRLLPFKFKYLRKYIKSKYRNIFLEKDEITI